MQLYKCIWIQTRSLSINPTQSIDTLPSYGMELRNKAVAHHSSAAAPQSSDTDPALQSWGVPLPTCLHGPASTPQSIYPVLSTVIWPPCRTQQPLHTPLTLSITLSNVAQSQPPSQHIPPAKESSLQTPTAAGNLAGSITTVHFYEQLTHTVWLGFFPSMRHFLTNLSAFPKQILPYF